MTIKPEDVEWSRQLFASIRPGGTWAIPRSGIIFRKDGDALVLISEMPHMPEMPITPEQLRKQQDADFNLIKEAFGRAGIEVRRG